MTDKDFKQFVIDFAIGFFGVAIGGGLYFLARWIW